jgi:HK97 family phage major capsid protein
MSEAQQLIEKINKEHDELKSRVIALEKRHADLGIDGDPEAKMNLKAMAGAIADNEAKLAKLGRLAAAPDPITIADDLLTKGLSRGKKSDRPFFLSPADEAKFLITQAPEYRRAFDHALRKGGPSFSQLRPDGVEYGILSGGVVPESVKSYIPDEHKSVLTIDFDPAAGFMAPPTVEAEIDRAVLEMSPFGDLCRTVNVGTGSYVWYQRSNNRETLQAVGERDTFTEETQQVRYTKRSTQAYTIQVSPGLSQEAIEDASQDLAAELVADASEDFAVLRGRHLLTGTGVEQATGLMTSSLIGSMNSGDAATFTMAALKRLPQQIKGPYKARGSYLVSRDALTTMMLWRVDSGAGVNTGPFMWEPSTQVGTPSRVNGFPWHEMVDMDDVAANAYPVAFGDWYRAYRQVVRRGLRVVRDSVTRPQLSVFHMTVRYGGDVDRGEAAVKLKCAA